MHCDAIVDRCFDALRHSHVAVSDPRCVVQQIMPTDRYCALLWDVLSAKMTGCELSVFIFEPRRSWGHGLIAKAAKALRMAGLDTVEPHSPMVANRRPVRPPLAMGVAA